MPTSDCFVSVVAPLFNDVEIVAAFTEEITAVLKQHYAHYELVLVDDASRDATVERVRQLLQVHECVRLIQLSRPFGQEIAISAGLDSVIGDYVAVMLPDSDPPALVPGMVEKVRRGAGVVFGVRKHRQGEPFLLRVGAAGFFWYCQRFLKLGIPPNTTHFRVLARQAVNAVTRIKDRSRYLRTLSTYVGYAHECVVYEPIQRRTHPRRKGLFEAIKLALSIIVANSTHPLRAASVLGLTASTLNVLYVAYILGVYLFKEQVREGWVTQSLQTAVMFFLMFLILTLLAEYVGRLLDEVKNRPLYYVADEKHSSVMIADEDRKNVVEDSDSQ